MKTILLVVGKTQNRHLDALIEDYCGRIGHFIPFGLEVVPDIKNAKALAQTQQKEKEGDALLSRLHEGDYVVLLDEHGREMRSIGLADWLSARLSASPRRLVFVIGGPYGFSPQVEARAGEKLSLSQMTFSHQMIRLLFTEQLYRALTIRAGLPYHHE